MDELTELEEKVLDIINYESEMSKTGSVYWGYLERVIRNRLGENVYPKALIENLLYLGKVIYTDRSQKGYFIKPTS
ncbi:MAG: hypothetical protein QW412_01640 [Candidatus Aenigmatarchaeota archaeon]